MEGNQMKMREALENIAGYAETARCHTEDAHVLGYLEQIEKWAEVAISAPARNCDLYNDVEDAWQDHKQFRRQTGEDVYFDMVHFWPFAKWLLAPAAERKGECDGR